jgi:hypothetical protein
MMAVKGAGTRIELGGEDRGKLELIARAASAETRMVQRLGSCSRPLRG